MQIDLFDILLTMKPDLAIAAEKATNDFDWEAPGVDSGACGDVAEAMKRVLDSKGIIAKFDYVDDEWESEPFHTRLKVTDPVENIDIIIDLPYHYYESPIKDATWEEPGWKLINNKIDSNMILIDTDDIQMDM